MIWTPAALIILEAGFWPIRGIAPKPDKTGDAAGL
jgi:hypothetical protein